jgi:hypothetical protein
MMPANPHIGLDLSSAVIAVHGQWTYGWRDSEPSAG